jgi:hypothetical protein
MGRSASIKSVLPALAPEFSYDDLPIGNGGDASENFLAMINGTFTGNTEETRQHLLQYCERDTYGMVVLWRVLKEKTCVKTTTTTKKQNKRSMVRFLNLLLLQNY